ncbi:MAG: TRAP transporter small permease [Ignavibacteriales bacterium]
MVKIREKFGRLVTYSGNVSVTVCFLMMAITTLDVAVRKSGVFNIKGSNELVEMGMVFMVFLGIASLQVKDGHVKVDMLVMCLPWRAQHLLRSVILFVEVLVFGAVCYASVAKYLELLRTPVYTGVLEMPYAPFYIVMIVGLVSFTILLLMDSAIELGRGVTRSPDSF